MKSKLSVIMKITQRSVMNCIFLDELQYAARERGQRPFYSLKVIFWLIVMLLVMLQKLQKFNKWFLIYFSINSILQNFERFFHFVVRFIWKIILPKNCDYNMGPHTIIAIFEEYLISNESRYERNKSLKIWKSGICKERSQEYL